MTVMKLRQLVAMTLCVLAAGCSWIPYALNNMVETPTEVVERYTLRCRFRRMAKDAWAQCGQGQNYSRYYERGFKEGFVEFLDADGTGNPPAVPPWWYRQNRFLTPEGQLEVEDWLAGYRQGALVARASGYRRIVTVSVTLPPLHTPGPEAPQVPVIAAPEAAVTLPPPRIQPAPGKEEPELVPLPTPQPPGGKKDGAP
jgi:hypothetical protein